MKKLVLLLIGLSFANGACAQTQSPKPDAQVRLVKTSVFYDQKVGIIPLVLAVKKLDPEFEPAIAELEALRVKLQSLNNKAREYESIRCSFNTKESETRAKYEKRKLEVTTDLRSEISKRLEQFAEENGYLIVLSDSNDFVSENAADVTLEFIRYFHGSPKKK